MTDPSEDSRPTPSGSPNPSAPEAAVERLAAQMGFLLEADQLKSVLRRGYLADGSRRENSGEHSWTLALMAIVLAEHAAEPVDLLTVLRMVVIHDVVEVDVGDTFVYDDAAREAKPALEAAAAVRLFGLLPEPTATDLRELWDEFENGDSAEARFARSLDRFAGFLLNHASDGRSWSENGVTADRVYARNEEIADGAPALWGEVQRRWTDGVRQGWLRPAAR